MMQSTMVQFTCNVCGQPTAHSGQPLDRERLARNAPAQPARLHSPEDPMVQDSMRRETSALIAADKVEGTAVYDLHSNKVGTIETLMIDKLSGHTMCTGVQMPKLVGLQKAPLPPAFGSV